MITHELPDYAGMVLVEDEDEYSADYDPMDAIEDPYLADEMVLRQDLSFMEQMEQRAKRAEYYWALWQGACQGLSRTLIAKNEELRALQARVARLEVSLRTLDAAV